VGGAIVTVTLEPIVLTESPCLADPDRWTEGGDDPSLKSLCRGCPRRFLCATEALETPFIEGMVAGVHVPKEGRPRHFAMRQLQSLAAYGGYASQPEIP
jgi:WhiB family transcriptional regulator, redox-sensing transcriptional regulator